MTPASQLSTQPSSRPAGTNWFLKLVFAAFVALLALIVSVPLAVASYFGLRGDLAALRRDLGRSSTEGIHRQVEVNVGWITCDLARAALRFVPMEPEARLAISSLRGAQVGVYQLDRLTPLGGGRRFLVEADSSLGRRGWERVVGVMSKDTCVGVYMLAKPSACSPLKFCVMVLTEGQMVLTQASGNPEPLIKLLLAQAHRNQWGRPLLD